MSGIYVKGVQLPEGCERCWFGARVHNGTFFCLAAKRQTEMPELVHERRYKPEWCPVSVVTTDAEITKGE